MTGQDLREAQKDLESKGKNIGESALYNATKPMRIASTLPGFAESHLQGDEHFKGNKLEGPVDHEELTSIMETAVEGSSKLAYIEDVLIPQLAIETWSTWEIGNDAPFKAIVFCEFPFTAALIFEYLKKKHGAESTVSILSEDNSKARERSMTFFDIDESKIENLSEAERKCRDRAMFLVTTYRIGCVGIDLRAAGVVLMLEVPYDQSSIDQAKARAAREGQTKTVKVYKFTATTQEKSLLECNNLAARVQALTGRH